jgi:hypothetical protein
VYAAAPLSTSENDLVLGIKFTPVPESRSTDASPAASPARIVEAGADEQDEPRISWPLLLLGSYASALTLAIAWLLWTGRTVRGLPSSEPEPTAKITLTKNSRQGPGRLSDRIPPLPARNLVGLGNTLKVGDLEITPRSIVRRGLELVRLEGATGDRREGSPSLVLEMSLINRSGAQGLAPLEPAFVRDSNIAVDQAFIENPGGRRISMFRLATESEWSIEGQVFPTLGPGEGTDTILVSEPVQVHELSGALIWHVKLRTSVFQTDVVGVRFTPQDVVDNGP